MFSNIGAKIKNVTLLSHFLRRSREKGFQIKFMKTFIGGQTVQKGFRQKQVFVVQ